MSMRNRALPKDESLENLLPPYGEWRHEQGCTREKMSRTLVILSALLALVVMGWLIHWAIFMSSSGDNKKETAEGRMEADVMNAIGLDATAETADEVKKETEPKPAQHEPAQPEPKKKLLYKKSKSPFPALFKKVVGSDLGLGEELDKLVIPKSLIHRFVMHGEQLMMTKPPDYSSLMKDQVLISGVAKVLEDNVDTLVLMLDKFHLYDHPDVVAKINATEDGRTFLEEYAYLLENYSLMEMISLVNLDNYNLTAIVNNFTENASGNMTMDLSSIDFGQFQKIIVKAVNNYKVKHPIDAEVTLPDISGKKDEKPSPHADQHHNIKEHDKMAENEDDDDSKH